MVVAAGETDEDRLRRGFDDVLAAARKEGLVKGAYLVTRDGFPIAGECPGVARPEMFAAMQATALGSTELALDETGASTNVLLTAELGSRRFVSRGVGTRYFVVAEAEDGSDMAALAAWIDGLGSLVEA